MRWSRHDLEEIKGLENLAEAIYAKDLEPNTILNLMTLGHVSHLLRVDYQ